ncbi:hypothetical protein UQW22_09890 [Isoptericola halotolerans]|uniref:hypothetical protein n=1 Tax=Isoptericola halotolerans TaxID=300560 RepID=UPI00389104A6
MRSRTVAVVAAAVLALSAACSGSGAGGAAPTPEPEPVGDFGPFDPVSVCGSFDRADQDGILSVEIEGKVARDSQGAVESARVVCPEYLDEVEESAQAYEAFWDEYGYDGVESEPDDTSEPEGVEEAEGKEAEPEVEAEEPPYEEMYPVAVESCIGYMVDEGIATRKDAARQQCEAAMGPDREDTHWMIDQYYTLAN